MFVSEIFRTAIWSFLAKALLPIVIIVSGYALYQYTTIRYYKGQIQELELRLAQAESGLEFMEKIESDLYRQKDFIDKYHKTITNLCKRLMDREDITDEEIKGLMKKEKR